MSRPRPRARKRPTVCFQVLDSVDPMPSIQSTKTVTHNAPWNISMAQFTRQRLPPRPQNQQPATNRVLITIDDLPDDILMIIVEMLAPQFPQLDERPSRRFSITKDIQKLANLCLVSRRFDRIARPLLYRRTYISSVRVLLNLLSSVYHNNALGLYIKDIFVDITWREYQKEYANHNILSQRGATHYGQFSPLRRPYSRILLQRISPPESFPAGFCRLLKRTTNLRSLVLGVCSTHCFVPSQDPFWCEMGGRIYGCIMQPGNFLPMLTTVQIHGHRVRSFNYLVGGILDLPNVETIICHNDDGDWSDTIPLSRKPQHWYRGGLVELTLGKSQRFHPLAIWPFCIQSLDSFFSI